MTKTKDGRPYAHKVKVSGLQHTMALLMPKKTQNEVYLNQLFDATELVKWLEEHNRDRDHDHRITLFHCIMMAVAKMIRERPKMNRFIKNGTVWQREEVSLSFVVKQRFSDRGEEELLFYVPKEEENIFDISADLIGDISQVRKAAHNSNHTGDVMETLARLPLFIQKLACSLAHLADQWQISPRSLTNGDPNYSTVLASNLGSIRCPAVYHHLNEYGTCSILLTIGTLHKEEVLMEDGHKEIREVVDIGVTLDERMADGFYFARSLKLIRHIFAHPELLEMPLGLDSGFMYD
jgi:pyruvate/2-oxoglutarate dehydrogenase complex dihydrolipoamide acyltransferase (E2) component